MGLFLLLRYYYHFHFRFYLYALAAAGQPGVEKALDLMRQEIERDMRLMGARSISELTRENLRYRY